MNQPIILYDGSCSVCSRLIVWVLRHDGGYFRIATQHSNLYKSYVAQGLITPATTKNAETVYLVEQQTVYMHAAAVIRILRHCGKWGRAYAWLLSLFPSKVRNGAYAAFASIRHRLTRKNVCPVPTKEFMDRML